MQPREASAFLRKLEDESIANRPVPISKLRELAKEIERDDEISQALWNSRLESAQILAILIADPKRVFEKDLNRWINEASPRVLEALGSDLLARFNKSVPLVDQWADSEEEPRLILRHHLIAGLVVRRRLQVEQAMPWLDRELKVLDHSSDAVFMSALRAIESLGGISQDANELAQRVLPVYLAQGPEHRRIAVSRTLDCLRSLKLRARIGHYRPVTSARQ